MERRNFLKLISAAAASVAVPGALRTTAIENIANSPRPTKASDNHTGYVRDLYGPRCLQWGETNIGDDGRAVVLFPIETYTTMTVKAQAASNTPVLISSMTRTGVTLHGAPGDRVQWVAVGEIHDGRRA